MSEINATDQRPRTTTAEMPEKLRALKPLPKDPQIMALIEKLKAEFKTRFERRQGERRQG